MHGQQNVKTSNVKSIYLLISVPAHLHLFNPLKAKRCKDHTPLLYKASVLMLCKAKVAVCSEIQGRREKRGRQEPARNLYPLRNDIFLNFFGSRQCWRTNVFWGSVPKLQIICWETLSHVGHSWGYSFPLFHWRLSVPYRLAPRVVARVARPLTRPAENHTKYINARLTPGRISKC